MLLNGMEGCGSRVVLWNKGVEFLVDRVGPYWKLRPMELPRKVIQKAVSTYFTKGIWRCSQDLRELIRSDKLSSKLNTICLMRALIQIKLTQIFNRTYTSSNKIMLTKTNLFQIKTSLSTKKQKMLQFKLTQILIKINQKSQ